jgi:thioesterase domain-containing protein
MTSRFTRPDENDVRERDLQALMEHGQDTDDALIRTILAIDHASQAYHPVGKTYPGTITFFWANDDSPDFEDNRLGWKRVAAGGVEVYRVPGTHATIREEPYVKVLVAELQPCLRRAHGQNNYSQQ